MNKNQVIFDQYYTNEDLSNELCNYIKEQEWFSNIERIIEPSAGSGSFSNNFNNCLAFDLDPKIDNIIQCDFLKYKIDYKKNTLILGNPPFGKNGSLALKFIKKSFTLGDYIAFILPLSFSKDSYKNRIPLSHSLLYEKILDKNSFHLEDNTNYSVKCVFQIWKKGLRDKIKFLKECDDFYFTKKEYSDFAIRRVGWYSGRISLDTKTVSPSSHYFIKVKTDNIESIIERLNKINWSNFSELTVGPRSLSMNEIIKIYSENY